MTGRVEREQSHDHLVVVGAHCDQSAASERAGNRLSKARQGAEALGEMMDEHTEVVLRDIRGLVRAIHAETGLHISYSEDHFTIDSLGVQVAITTEEDIEIFRGGSKPWPDWSTSFEELRETLSAWLVAARKEAA